MKRFELFLQKRRRFGRFGFTSQRIYAIIEVSSMMNAEQIRFCGSAGRSCYGEEEPQDSFHRPRRRRRNASHAVDQDRAKPAVPFGGVYRLIDFPLSNLVNSGYSQVIVLTQYKSHSLDRHISQLWRFSTLLGNYVSPSPHSSGSASTGISAQQTPYTRRSTSSKMSSLTSW